MQTPYIPTTDTDFDLWLANFSTLITASPTTYGLVAGDATIIAASNTAWHTAYLLATNPATRTSPAIAGKDAQRASATATVRPYAINISQNSGVLDSDKIAVGVNLPNPSRTPVPTPTTQPVLKLNSVLIGTASFGYYDVTTPLSKAKPFGAVGMELWRTIGTAPSVSPDDSRYVGVITKSPNNIAFDSGDAGKVCTLWGRWVTRSGVAGNAQTGPWSTALAFNIV